MEELILKLKKMYDKMAYPFKSCIHKGGKLWQNKNMEGKERKPYPGDMTGKQWEEVSLLYSRMRNRTWSIL